MDVAMKTKTISNHKKEICVAMRALYPLRETCDKKGAGANRIIVKNMPK